MKGNRFFSLVLASAMGLTPISSLSVLTAVAADEPALTDWAFEASYTETFDADNLFETIDELGWEFSRANYNSFTDRTGAISFYYDRWLSYSQAASDSGKFYYKYKLGLYNETADQQVVKLMGASEYIVVSTPDYNGAEVEFTTVVDTYADKAYTYTAEGTVVSSVSIADDTIKGIKFHNVQNDKSCSFWIYDFEYGTIKTNSADNTTEAPTEEVTEQPSELPSEEPTAAPVVTGPSILSYWTLDEAEYTEPFDFDSSLSAKDMRQELISKGWTTTERDDALAKRTSAVSFDWNRFAQYNKAADDGLFYYTYNIQMYNSKEAAQLVNIVGTKEKYTVLASPAAVGSANFYTTVIDTINSIAYTYNSDGKQVAMTELNGDTILGIEFRNTVNTNSNNSFWIYDFSFGLVKLDITTPEKIVVKSNSINDGKELEMGEIYTVNAASFVDTVIEFDEPVSYLENGTVPIYTTDTLEIKMADGSSLPSGITVNDNILTVGTELTQGEYAIDVVATAKYKNEVLLTQTYNLNIIKNKVTPDEIVNDYVPEIKSNGTIVSNNSDIKNDIVLPQSNGIMNIEWSSNNSDVISEEGTVTRPIDDTTVTLTAVITSKEDSSKSKTVMFVLNVKGVGEMLNNAIAEAKAALVSADNPQKFMDAANLADLHEDIKLYTIYKNSAYEEYTQVKYEWTSDSDALKITNDIAEIYPSVVKVYMANLTLKARLGNTFVAEIIPVKINLTPENAAAKYAVRCDDIASENFADIAEYEGKTVSSNINVPTKGIFGSIISWTSSVPMYMSNTGDYTAPKTDTKAVMTGIVSNGTVISEQTHQYKFTVKGKNSATSSSGGGGGGSFSAPRYDNPVSAPVTTPVTSPQGGTSEQINGFNDLAEVSWATEAINALAKLGIVSGKNNAEFAPNDNVTRAEFAKMVVNAFGFKSEKLVSVFTDVNENDWYYSFIAAAYENDIINGYDDGTFGVNDNITRQDMAVILYRAIIKSGIKLDDVNAEIIFDDIDSIADYAKEAVTELQKMGVINGISDTEFAPNENASRAQAAKMIYEIIK